jgi:hypothetical protein
VYKNVIARLRSGESVHICDGNYNSCLLVQVYCLLLTRGGRWEGMDFLILVIFFSLFIFLPQIGMGNNSSFWDPANRKVEINGIVFHPR